jgi:hypothetical protein
MLYTLKKFSDFTDALGALIISAPDRFPLVGDYGLDSNHNLLVAFQRLDNGFHLVEKKIKSPERLAEIKQMLADALIAYQNGEKRKGSHLLQDVETILDPNMYEEYLQRKGLTGDE